MKATLRKALFLFTIAAYLMVESVASHKTDYTALAVATKKELAAAKKLDGLVEKVMNLQKEIEKKPLGKDKQTEEALKKQLKMAEKELTQAEKELIDAIQTVEREDQKTKKVIIKVSLRRYTQNDLHLVSLLLPLDENKPVQELNKTIMAAVRKKKKAMQLQEGTQLQLFYAHARCSENENQSSVTYKPCQFPNHDEGTLKKLFIAYLTSDTCSSPSLCKANYFPFMLMQVDPSQQKDRKQRPKACDPLCKLKAGDQAQGKKEPFGKTPPGHLRKQGSKKDVLIIVLIALLSITFVALLSKHSRRKRPHKQKNSL